MKKIKKLLFIFTFFSITTFCISSCTRTETKLAVRWVVNYATIFDSDAIVNKDSAKLKEIDEQEDQYKGQVYDLNPDGSFTINGSQEESNGTWVMQNNRVVFKRSTGEELHWYPINDKIEIARDSSISVKLDTNKLKYVELTLKPAPGEQIKTDY